jgi:uncharacterized Zn-binding protein involved in type VI secretion
MQPAARTGDMHVCPMATPAFPSPIPHVGGPVLPPCAPLVFTGGPNQARISDLATCVGPPDVIAVGAATVLVQGLPASRMGDATVHGGSIAIGLPTVLIGGPAFSLPPNFKIDGPPDFQQKTIRDLYFLSTTPTGKALIDRLGAAGETVTFVPTSDNNGYCSPNNGLFALLGIPTGSTIQYNPDYRSNAYDASGNLIAQPPQVILAHEMSHALANSEGDHRYGTDPSPPASEPNIEEEEAQAIGTGSHTGRNPSENSLRSDLGLPARDNHFGTGGPAPGEPPPLNLRPGDPPL